MNSCVEIYAAEERLHVKAYGGKYQLQTNCAKQHSRYRYYIDTVPVMFSVHENSQHIYRKNHCFKQCYSKMSQFDLAAGNKLLDGSSLTPPLLP